MLLNEIILTKPIFEEVQREKLPDGVLCRVTYNVNNIGERNANKRVYEKAVWDKVLADNDLKKKLESRALFGHAEHPEQTQSNLEKTSHVIFEMWIDEKENQVYQKIDVLDTPTGRIVDTLLRAGCQVGVSTRAEGDLEEAEDDDGTYQRVIPESYRYVTTDFTADPSTFGVVPQDVKRNIVSTIGKEYHNESADKSEREFARLLLEHMKCKKAIIGKCRNCGCCGMLKEKQYIMEGIWAVPNTQKKVDKLEDLLKEPLSPSVAEEELNNIFGTDALYDDLDTLKKKEPDARKVVIKHLKQLVKDYKKDPEDFTVKFEEDVIDQLGGLIEKKENEKTVKDLITDSTIKVGTKVKYGDQDAEVEKIDETTVNLTVGVGKPTFVDVHGDASISVSPEGIITILPTETVEKLIPIAPEAPKPELPSEEEKDKMAAAGPLPIEDETPEEEKESKLKEILGIKVDTKFPIFESVENVSYVTVGKVIERPCILVKSSKDRETLQGIVVSLDEEAISKGREIASVLGVEFRVPAKTESVKISEISKLMEEIQGELVDLRKVLGEGYLRGIEEKSVESISDTTKEDLEETKGIAKLYQDAGLPAPKGKGIHTRAFHELAVEVAKGYVKGSKNKSPMSPAKALELAYPTAMKQLGKEKAVKKAHRTKESIEGSISTTAKKIIDLKVQEASTRAERDKALELLEELTSENQVTNKDKALEAKMLVSRIRKILEAKEQEVDALRTKLEEKAKLASELKEKGIELKEELDKVKINLVTDIRKLEEAANVTEERHLSELKQLESKHVEEVKQLIEKHNKNVEQLKSEFNTKISEGVEKAKKEVIGDFVKRFVALRLTESELKVDDNSRALLENCKSLEDVDDTFDEILDASRRGALHSNLLESITVNKPVVDPEQREAERQVNNVFEGMGFIKKG